MSCDCYRIGGPFIAEDPGCPVHGVEAQVQAQEDARRLSMLGEAEALIENIEDYSTRRALQIIIQALRK
jgi:hypothetical protein